MAKVLVIDDSRLSTSALSNFLSEMNHSVIDVAHSGEEGVQKAKNTNPDVVCLDMVMPGIDGKETAQQLKKVNSGIKIIMITQSEISSDDKNQIGAVHYIVKPITKSKLEEAFGKV